MQDPYENTSDGSYLVLDRPVSGNFPGGLKTSTATHPQVTDANTQFAMMMSNASTRSQQMSFIRGTIKLGLINNQMLENSQRRSTDQIRPSCSMTPADVTGLRRSNTLTRSGDSAINLIQDEGSSSSDPDSD